MTRESRRFGSPFLPFFTPFHCLSINISPDFYFYLWRFFFACSAPRYAGTSVRLSVCRLRDFLAHCSRSNALVTFSIADPNHPHATGVDMYPALFLFLCHCLFATWKLPQELIHKLKDKHLQTRATNQSCTLLNTGRSMKTINDERDRKTHGVRESLAHSPNIKKKVNIDRAENGIVNFLVGNGWLSSFFFSFWLFPFSSFFGKSESVLLQFLAVDSI